MSDETTTVVLHTEDGVALAEERVYETVKAAAEGLAERYGLEVLDVEADAEAITITLGADEVTAVGFAAELRRTTNAWYEGKYASGPLWRTPREW
ncbi:MAG TPA: hypothetical protein VD997_14850 [Phycisphaerales bacterium]|nr:hypothetical protein [Phycisphaerales bacterium]